MTRALSLSKRCKLTALLITTAILIVLLPSFASGQSSTPDRGFQPGGSFALSDIETINTTNGNLMLNLALGKLAPGRGGMSGQLSLHYDSKIYDSRSQYYEDWEHLVFGEPQQIIRNMLMTSDQGGWHYGTGYQIQLIDRLYEYPPEIMPQYPAQETIYHYKLKVAFPDGSLREFFPRVGSLVDQGYSDIRPDGYQSRFNGSYVSDVPYFTNNVTYYTFDGTYIRLDVQHDSDANWWNNPWTLYFPDGTTVTNFGTKITDRNGNYVEWSNITYNGHAATQLMDQVGRKVILEYAGFSGGDVIHVTGVGGADLTYQVYWKSIQVFKTYSTIEFPQHAQDPDGYPDMLGSQYVVSRIDLPAATGGLQYLFGYNAADYGSTPCCTPSYGWGELSSVTLPSGAQAQYQYRMDGQNGPGLGYAWTYVLNNNITSKSLTHQQQYDGTSTPVTETWTYDISIGAARITSPDGGVTRQIGQPTFISQSPDGTVSEKIWQGNRPQNFFSTSAYNQYTGIDPYDPVRVNSNVKTEFTTIRDANGTCSKTAIKDYSYDKNGNVTSIREYDWVAYGSVPRDASGFPTGIPAGAVLKRVTSNSYVAATPDASDSSSNDPDSYWIPTSPNLKSPMATTEVSNGTTTSARTEFFYDNAGTTGNLTQKIIWDSTKGSLTRPLSAANSISLSNQYDAYGNVTVATDARGVQTTFSYGAISGFSNLYPTQIIVGSNYPTLARTTNNEYEFYTGLPTKVTDVDNNVASSTTYDVFGRPVLVKEAEGKSEETRTATEYSDVNRRVIIRSDLSAIGDGKLVTIQHFDQLGRVRLNRRLEDATTQSATDETTGIKTQTRYIVTNPCAPTNAEACINSNGPNLGSYKVVSNPYRAATSATANSEQSMGWTRTRKDKGGRVIEVESFGGATLPSPWGVNSTSTGKGTSGYDANFMTMSDQTGKVRRTMSNALGQLVRVDEPDATNNLGSTSSPVQATTYDYDMLGNMISVNQGTQVRTFTYSSLSRLTSVFQPESGTTNYQYDPNGNLLVVTDARSVSTHFSYDSFNRATRRWHNSSSNPASTTNNNPALPTDVSFTEEANYYYDAQSLPSGAPTYSRGQSKGRLVALTHGTGSAGDYYSYDPLGRQVLKIQQTGGTNYQISSTFNRAGIATQVVYPSSHTVTQSLDNAGRITGVSGTLGNGTSRNYSTGILYSAGGGVIKEQFGTTTPVYNKLFYNSRGQLTEIRESTSYTGPSDTDWNRGLIINHYSNQCSGLCSGSAMTDNNGTLKKQEMYIPADDQTSSYTLRWQQYDYDSLNRVNWVREVTGGVEQWKQQFSYDRWGNRTINTATTYGVGINNKSFTVDAANNRLGVPSGQSGVMSYDLAGNLTNDTYTGMGIRTYDASNKMTSAWGGANQLQQYSYDAWGKRVRRTVDGTETWQVYGLADELLAEYSANGSPSAPQKEYGYRNGQMLITASAGGDQSLNLNGTGAYVQVPNSSSVNIAGAITVEAWIKLNAITAAYQDIITRESWGQTGTGGGFELSVTNTGKLRLDTYQSPTTYTPLVGSATITTGVWHHVAGVFDGSQMRLYVDGVLDATVSTTNGPASGTSSLKIGRTSGGSYFGGLIDEARVSNSAVYTSNFTPQTHLTATGSTKGLWKFDGSSTVDSSGNANSGSLQSGASYSTDVPTGPSTSYYSGAFNGTSAYVQVPNSSSVNIAGAITVEAWIKLNAITAAYQDIITRESWGQTGTGGGFELSVTNTGKLRLDTYQSPTTYTPLVGSATITTGVWHHVAGVFDGSQMRLYVDGALDATLSTTNGPASGTSSLKIGRTSGGSYFGGLIDEARVSNSAVYTSNFTPQTHLTATGSTKGLWKFDSQSTADSSGNGNNGTLQSGATYSDDVPSGDGGGGQTSGGSGSQILWLVSDHLGTPRIIFDETGALANVRRHDYLPFGEELVAPIGGRSASQGYTSGDGVRQQFTSHERDTEINLDYCGARYYSSAQGRFVAPDPLNASASASLPQSWNRYSYVLNKPLQLVDPTGMLWAMRHVGEGKDRKVEFIWYDEALSQEQIDAGYTPYKELWYFASDGAVFLSKDRPEEARIIPASVFEEESLGSPGYSVIRYADPSNMNDYQRSVLLSAFVYTHKGDPNSFMRRFWETFFLSITFGELMTAPPGRPPTNPRLGDLTAAETETIQATVNQAGRPLEVVGSAASGTRRGIGTELPIGKGPGTRSDIDYLVGGSSRPYWQEFQMRLPSIDPKTGIITGTHNPFMGPGIRFEPNTSPWKLPSEKP